MDEKTKCQCGRIARVGELCFLCYQKKTEQNRPSLDIENTRINKSKELAEGHELEYNLKRFFRQLGTRLLKPNSLFYFVKRTSIEYICTKCRKTKRNTRVFVDGVMYCKKCSELILEAKKAKDILNYIEAQGTLDEIDPLGEMEQECTRLGTCDILHFHHELLKDDPERLKTDFLIGLICGEEKMNKYNIKKDAQASIVTV